MLTEKKAVIFDMDGTLIDSMWVWHSVDEIYMQKYHLIEPDDFHEEMEGMSFAEVADYFLRAFPNLMLTTAEIMEEWHQLAMDKYRNEVQLKEGALEFLLSLKEQGICLGIATSNSRELAEAVLDAHGIRNLFDCILTSDEAKAGKPAPDIYEKVAEKLGAAPEECLVFVDTIAGIQAGQNGGSRVCAVAEEQSEG
ncbi:MAG: HAD family phosphatase, partial [Lachnospiraceae bacterium]|nr:HAD family phosphatase [Lachnospiraceae bacterium]